jgi:NAD(P)-dependent dehydrogenase (short-subunit alcohol dehydrogenase family)
MADDFDLDVFLASALAATELLEGIVTDPGRLALLDEAQRMRLKMAAGQVVLPDKKAKRQFAKARQRLKARAIKQADQAILANTGIRRGRAAPVFETPPALIDDAIDAPAPEDKDEERRTHKARICYVCKTKYHAIHHFYDHLCSPCADFNFSKRQPKADLAGRVALVTGGRVKIGYHVVIFLLRSGAKVIVTTRFPRDAATRFAKEADFEEWGDRLEVHGIDLRHTPSVEAFCSLLDRRLDRLDYIINNACQTVRRPSGFYQHLMDGERTAQIALPAREARLIEAYEAHRRAEGVHQLAGGAALTTTGSDHLAGITQAAELSQVELLDEDGLRGGQLFPTGQLDQDLQQIDARTVNSWRLALDEVSAVELLEVQLVNSIAPFIINARLKRLMARAGPPDKHIVNVSAMEGQFYRRFKTDRHPHTNMAKAALNMMTRTSAADYVRSGIHMNSVDTGWVTDEDPLAVAVAKRAEHAFHPPLDIVDGAARIVDPIFHSALTGEHLWGKFLKDYTSTDW